MSQSRSSHGSRRRGLDRDVVGVEASASGEHGPQDAGVFVGHGDYCLLPARALAQAKRPLRELVLPLMRRHHGRLRPLDEQGAQVLVPALGDVPEAGLAAAGVLLRHQPQPGAELPGVGELPEVAHAGHDGRGGDRTDAGQACDLHRLGVRLDVCGNALIAPGNVRLDLQPVQVRSLQGQSGEIVQLVGRVLDDIGQHFPQRLGTLREDQPERGQQPADAVDAGGALFLVALAQPVDAQQALLLDALDGHESHARARGSLADRGRVVGVVLTAAPLHAIRHDEVGRDQPGIEPEGLQLARPVMCPVHASIATKQPGGSCADHSANLPCASGLAKTTLPATSTA